MKNNINFETMVGALNLAPTKISGQYKIVVDTNNRLYLDDYCGRRIKIDMSQSFIEQVGRFLQVNQRIPNNEILQYGGFRKAERILSYHIPFYFNKNYRTGTEQSTYKYPEHFLLLKTNLTDFEQTENLYKESTPIKFVNLREIGLFNIFEEINSQGYFDFPFYLNWDNYVITLFGYDYSELRFTKKTIDLTDTVANQNYFDVVNNKILNWFESNKIIFPRFLNIEFEFTYDEPSQLEFADFFGYLGNTKIIEPNAISESKYPKVYHYNNTFENLIINDSRIQNDVNYDFPKYNFFIQDIAEHQKQIRFSVDYLTGNEIFSVSYLGSNVFTHRFELANVYNLEQKVNEFCIRFNKAFQNIFFSSYKQIRNNYIVWIKIVNEDEGYKIEVPKNFKNPDGDVFEFNEIKANDVWLLNNLNVDCDYLIFENQKYNIEKTFKFDDKRIIRLDSEINLREAKLVTFYKKLKKNLVEIVPIPFLSYYNDFEHDKLFNGAEYKKLLNERVNDYHLDELNLEIFNSALNSFNPDSTIENYGFLNNELEYLDYKGKLQYNLDNENIVKNIVFTNGSNSHLFQYLFNFSVNNYKQNASTKTNFSATDIYKFAWFLIDAKCPEYLLNDNRRFRYVYKQEPNSIKVFSILHQVSEYLCECIFLGVKYQFNLKYTGYKFMCIFHPNDLKHVDYDFNLEIDDSNKILILHLYKYLDYSDLVRFTKFDEEPIIDLSLLHGVREGYDLTSPYNANVSKLPNIEMGKTALETNPNLLEGLKINDSSANSWVTTYENKRYFLFTSIENLKEYFPDFENDKDLTLYFYLEVNNEKYQIAKIVFESTILHEHYFWCTDIKLSFYQNIKSFYIDKNNTIHKLYENKNLRRISGNKNDYFIKYRITLPDSLEPIEIMRINPSKTWSFADDYFEIVFNKQNSFEITKWGSLSESELKKLFNQKDNVTESTETKKQKLNLFDTNQFWLYFQNMLKNNLYYRTSSYNQIKRDLDKLTVSNFINELQKTNYNIKIKQNDDETEYRSVYEIIKPIETESNYVIWELENKEKLVEIDRYNSLYKPFFNEVNELEFQLNKNYLFNGFRSVNSPNFLDINVNATGFWQEIRGNILSSLFIGQDREISSLYVSELDLVDLLSNFVTENNFVYNSKNEKTISKINKNVGAYLKETYVRMLLNQFYVVDNVQNEFRQNLEFTVNNNKLKVNVPNNSIIIIHLKVK